MRVLTRRETGATLTPYLLEGKSKGTVLIFPGGAYRFVSPREGEPVANAFRRGGYNAFVLDYTVSTDENAPPLGKTPLQDAAWGIAHIRENAGEYSLDPDKIAVCGFSAGGHLAGMLGVYWHRPEFWGGEGPTELYKPNALVLSYAVLSGGMHRHQGSFLNLAGEQFKARLPYYAESQVSQRTPPTFLWHTSEDAAVPVQNSLLFANRLAEYEIPFELHVFPHGPHGLSLATEEVNEPAQGRNADPHVARWIDLCIEWLEITL